MTNILNPINHPIIFANPLRVSSSTWTTHVPFGMLVIDILRPKVVVELGAFAGMSYCAFCQAIQKLNIDAKCYAIDTWAGDHQSGYYGEAIFADLRAYHDPLYGHFSTLMRSTFEAALDKFDEQSIDLLHIDGLHTYEAVKEDFENWLPKMSNRGVILFHDIADRRDDFGVWRVWEELTQQYPSFEFHHGHGLGVLMVGAEAVTEWGEFLQLTPSEADSIREFFHQVGMRLELQLEVEILRLRHAQQEEAINWLMDQVKEYEELRGSPALRLTRSWRKRGLLGTTKKLLNRDGAS